MPWGDAGGTLTRKRGKEFGRISRFDNHSSLGLEGF